MFGGKTHPDVIYGVRAWFVCLVPGEGGYRRSFDAGFSPGGEGSITFTDAGLSSREGEAFYAPSSSVLAPKNRGLYSSTLSAWLP